MTIKHANGCAANSQFDCQAFERLEEALVRPASAGLSTSIVCACEAHSTATPTRYHPAIGVRTRCSRISHR